MKKIIGLFLIALAVVSLTACAGEEKTFTINHNAK